VSSQLQVIREELRSSPRRASTHNSLPRPSTRSPLAETRPHESELEVQLYPGEHVLTHLIRTYKGIASSTAKFGYRSDLRAEAVSRASALRQAQRPKKDAPEKKIRGVKAKKAAAEKDE
jgi:hypothetical protein